MEVRRVRPDEGALLRMVRLAALLDTPDAFGSTHADSSRHPESRWVERARTASRGATDIVLFAFVGDRPAGMVGAYTPETNQADRHLYGMWVDPLHRRSGIGREMVVRVLEWAAVVGADRVTLWVVDGNEPARRLYQRLGFQPTGRRQPLPSDRHLAEIEMARGVGRG